MSFFVVMYILDCIVSSSSRMFWNNDPVCLCVQMFVGNGYATISPNQHQETNNQALKIHVGGMTINV